MDGTERTQLGRAYDVERIAVNGIGVKKCKRKKKKNEKHKKIENV